jgi:hypothetical protein
LFNVQVSCASLANPLGANPGGGSNLELTGIWRCKGVLAYNAPDGADDYTTGLFMRPVWNVLKQTGSKR